jgi:demethylspheroidene O-methyltransferase
VQERWLTSRDFQRWALTFPLTKWIARRRAAALFDVCAGFVYSQVLLACVRLKIFEKLRVAPRSVSELAPELGLSPTATFTLMRAAAALGLLKVGRDPQCFGLGIHGAALLGNPGLLPMIEHHALFYEDLRDPVALLRGESGATRLGDLWAYSCEERPATISDGRAHRYTELMSASQALIADQVLDAYPLRRHHCLLDVGGGDGTFAAAAAARAPNLRILLFDLPPVAARARERFTRGALAHRARAVGGDFLHDPLPEGADVISLVRVLHDHDDDAVLRILRAVRRALPAHGRLVIAEPLSGASASARTADAYFGLYLLAMGSGRTRSLHELSRLLLTTGFAPPRLLTTRLPAQLRVVIAEIRCGKSVPCT